MSKNPTLQYTPLDQGATIFDVPCSVFKGVSDLTCPDTITIAVILNRIQNGDHKAKITRLRTLRGQNKARYDTEKKTLDAACFVGTFPERCPQCQREYAEFQEEQRLIKAGKLNIPKQGRKSCPSYRRICNFHKHSGFAICDLDDVSDIAGVKAQLCTDPYVAACFVSPSGTGLKFLVRTPHIDTDAQHKRILPLIAEHFQTAHDIEINFKKDGKDVSRLCFMSDDPDLYRNEHALEFPVPADVLNEPEPAPQPNASPQRTSPTTTHGNGTADEQALERAFQWKRETIATHQQSAAKGEQHYTRRDMGRLAGGILAGFGAPFWTEDQAVAFILSHDQAKDRKAAEKTIRNGITYGKDDPITTDDILTEWEEYKKKHPLECPPHPADDYQPVGVQASDPGPQPGPESATTNPQKGDAPGPGADVMRFVPQSTLRVKDGLTRLKYYELTEYGTRQRYLDQFCKVIRYNHTEEMFCVYNGTHWITDETALTSELVTRVIQSLEGDAKHAEKLLTQDWKKETDAPYIPVKDRSKEEQERLENDEKLRELTSQLDPLVNYAQNVEEYCFTKKKSLKTTVSHITALVKHDQQIATTAESFDTDPYLLNVKNGTLDLKTGKLTRHDPAQLLSKIANTCFDASAQCPEFLKFLHMIFENDRELVSYLQRAFGYSLTGLSDEKVLLFCYGKAGENGKTTLFNTVKMVLGDYFSTAQAEILMESRRPAGGALEGLANLKGARCVVTDELSGSSTLDIATVKRLTGADHEIKARFLYGHEFSFKPTHTLWMFGNEKPRITATDQATWNRVKTIPFEYSIPKSQQKPMEQVMSLFQQEAPGILNWMLDGWKVYRDDKKGLNVDVPEKIQVATQLYRDESDTLKSFLEECFVNGYDLVKGHDPGNPEDGIYPNDETMLNTIKEPRPDVWQTYKLWCQKYKERRVKQTDFFFYLEEHGFLIESGHANKYYVHGLRFPEEQPPHPGNQEQRPGTEPTSEPEADKEDQWYESQ